MENYQILIIFMLLSSILSIALIIFIIPKRYDIIDNKFEIKRSGFWFFVICYGEKRKKFYFLSYKDCIAFIEQKKKEDN